MSSISNVQTSVSANSAELRSALDEIYQSQLRNAATTQGSGSVLKDIMNLGKPEVNDLVDGIFNQLSSVDPQAALGFAFAVKASIGDSLGGSSKSGSAPVAGASSSVSSGGAVASTGTASGAKSSSSVDMNRLASDLSRTVASASEKTELPSWINDVTSKILQVAPNASKEQVNTMRSILNDILKPTNQNRESSRSVFNAFVQAIGPQGSSGAAEGTSSTTGAAPRGNSIINSVLQSVQSLVSDGSLSQSDLQSVDAMVSKVLGAAFGKDASDAYLNTGGSAGESNTLNLDIYIGGSTSQRSVGGSSGSSGMDWLGGSPSFYDSSFSGSSLTPTTTSTLQADTGISSGRTSGSSSSRTGATSENRPSTNVGGPDYTRNYMQYLAGQVVAKGFSQSSMDDLTWAASARKVSTEDLVSYVGKDFVNQLQSNLQKRANDGGTIQAGGNSLYSLSSTTGTSTTNTSDTSKKSGAITEMV